MVKKITTISAALFMVVGYSQGALCASDNTPNGQPFQALSSQISSVEAKVETMQAQLTTLVGQAQTLEDQLASYDSAIGTLTNQNADLQGQINANRGDITALQEQVEMNSTNIDYLQGQLGTLHDALAVKQNVINGSCPDGEALQGVNADGSVACQVLSGGSASTGMTTFKVYNYVSVSPMAAASASATCPEGSILTGGSSQLALTNYYPYYRTELGGVSFDGNIVTATAQGGYTYSNTMTVYALCASSN